MSLLCHYYSLYEEKTFCKFYNENAPRIYRFVYLKVNSPQDSEDLTSDAFLDFGKIYLIKRQKKKKLIIQGLCYTKLLIT